MNSCWIKKIVSMGQMTNTCPTIFCTKWKNWEISEHTMHDYKWRNNIWPKGIRIECYGTNSHYKKYKIRDIVNKILVHLEQLGASSKGTKVWTSKKRSNNLDQQGKSLDYR